jgi:hypothetical protein
MSPLNEYEREVDVGVGVVVVADLRDPAEKPELVLDERKHRPGGEEQQQHEPLDRIRS